MIALSWDQRCGPFVSGWDCVRRVRKVVEYLVRVCSVGQCIDKELRKGLF